MERIKALRVLQKYEMMYSGGDSRGTWVVIDIMFVYHFVDHDMGAEIFLEKQVATGSVWGGGRGLILK